VRIVWPGPDDVQGLRRCRSRERGGRQRWGGRQRRGYVLRGSLASFLDDAARLRSRCAVLVRDDDPKTKQGQQGKADGDW